MTKDYIVYNEIEEQDTLGELELGGFTWVVGEKPTRLVISKIESVDIFPYTVHANYKDKTITWSGKHESADEEMKKYSVTQVFMQDLNNWRDDWRIYAEDGAVLGWEDFQNEPERVQNWRLNTGSAIEANNRLIAIINWLNGEDVFVDDTPSYIIQVKGGNGYLDVEGGFELVSDKRNATVFYRLEDAKDYENAFLEAVELDEQSIRSVN